MNGLHDMGGMDGFGPVELETYQPVFNAPWEGRVMAIMRAMRASKAWNLDMFRDARERQPPAFYLTASYYKSWAKTLETLLLSRGLVTLDEIAIGRSLPQDKRLSFAPLAPSRIDSALSRGSYARPAPGPALFKVGDVVRTKNLHPSTHTRLPRYARGRCGTIERVHGCQVFPDTSALDAGDDPQWLYTVVFKGPELWGPDADAALTVSIEAFEPYLEQA